MLRIWGKSLSQQKLQKGLTTMNVKNESMNEELDIVKEFNTILESVADDSNFNHDRYNTTTKLAILSC